MPGYEEILESATPNEGRESWNGQHEEAFERLDDLEAGGAALANHLSDTTDAHDASAISVADVGGNFAATEVEGALTELYGTVVSGGTPDATETVKGKAELATQAETNTGTDDARIVTPAKLASYTGITNKALANDLTNHLNDATDAHDASAISYAGGTGMSATDLEAAVDELASEKANDSALTAHIDDTTDAHDATAISFTSAGTIAATTVQAAIEEVASEAGGGSGYRTKVTLGSDVANATNVLADGTGLSFAVSAGTVYGFEFMVRYTASAASIGARFALNGPAFTEFGYTSQWTNSSTSNLVANWQSYDAGATSTASAGTFGNICMIWGQILPSASGTLILRFAAESGGTITLKTGSTLEWWVA